MNQKTKPTFEQEQPVRPQNWQRTIVVRVRLSPAEKEKLERLAWDAGCNTMSEYIRMMTLGES